MGTEIFSAIKCVITQNFQGDAIAVNAVKAGQSKKGPLRRRVCGTAEAAETTDIKGFIVYTAHPDRRFPRWDSTLPFLRSSEPFALLRAPDAVSAPSRVPRGTGGRWSRRLLRFGPWWLANSEGRSWQKRRTGQPVPHWGCQSLWPPICMHACIHALMVITIALYASIRCHNCILGGCSLQRGD